MVSEGKEVRMDCKVQGTMVGIRVIPHPMLMGERRVHGEAGLRHMDKMVGMPDFITRGRFSMYQ